MSEQRGREVYRSLQALARTDYGGNTGALLVVYAVEGFLRRLAASPYAANMTLKGGMLMAATSARRMTKDADLATVGVANEEAAIATAVREIIAVALDDGLAFEVTTLRTELMREDADYHGVRVKLEALLSTARITTTLDFSFGDPHRAVVIELPELLGAGTIRLASYPPELTMAEKIATMMSRRELNTRDRDFADVWVLSRWRNISARSLRAAIDDVAAHRHHDAVPLADALANMPNRQLSYSAMLRRLAYQRPPPKLWADLLADVSEFVDTLLADISGELTTWDAHTTRWRSD